MLVINSFEKLAESLPFLNMTEERVFTLDMESLAKDIDECDNVLKITEVRMNKLWGF